MTPPDAHQLTLDIARHIHKIAEARQTFLFGSRARRDHRGDSDIDLLVITGNTTTDSWLENLRQTAQKVQKARMPEASGIDIISMSEHEFLNRIHLRNNMANTIAKEGCPVMPDENLGYRNEFAEEKVDWQDVEQKMTDATGAITWIKGIKQAGILDLGDDKQFGRMAQNALEFAYKSVLAAHGHEYPIRGRDGHNLTILTQLLRDREVIGGYEEAPGENHRYLTEFGGAAVHAHEHPPLDRRLIAEDIPDAVARLKDMVANAR